MDGRSITREAALEIARREAGPSTIERQLAERITALEAENMKLRNAAGVHLEAFQQKHVEWVAAVNERDALRAEVGRLEKAIRWALGEDPPGTPDFAAEHEMELERRERGELDHAFWWRNTLRRLAALESTDG